MREIVLFIYRNEERGSGEVMLLKWKDRLMEEDLSQGNFGIEREGLRITPEGVLASTPHPEVFGNKLSNPSITTDFSESQIEMITPVCQTVQQVYHSLSALYRQTIVGLEKQEYLWPQSMPCVLAENQVVPVAHFGQGVEGQALTNYRQKLLEKYGPKKQLISGIHYNFSFSESLLKKLYESQASSMSYPVFKEQVYLKIVRQYLRYRWVLIYFLGASPVVDASYMSECDESLMKIAQNSYAKQGAISFRNSSYGYQNQIPIYAQYQDVQSYIHSLQTYIEEGQLLSVKEFYSPIRLKAKDSTCLMESLKKDGISYIEIRSIDLNPFEPLGISLADMQFIHLFILFLLDSEEVEAKDWQQEAAYNEQQVALNGRRPFLKIQKLGHEILMSDWAREILEKMQEINEAFSLDLEKVIRQKMDQLTDPQETIAGKIIELTKQSNYSELNLKLAKLHKENVLHRSFPNQMFKTLDLEGEDEVLSQ